MTDALGRKPTLNKNLSIVALHKHPEFLDDCKEILNYQWPRSETLRYRSLNASCDKLPTSLVLVEFLDGECTKVLGHARINTLPNEEDSVWIESVIIHHDLRGRGYGRILMTLTESYALTLGFKFAVLSTRGEEDFYKKLGYTFCPPVSLYGGVVNKLLLPKCFVSSALNNNVGLSCNSLNIKKGQNAELRKPNLQSKTHSAPVPPPPLKKSDILHLDTFSQKIFMRKPLA